MNLDKFLTQALIESLNNGLIAPELITVYAGNYLAKSLITADEMTQVQNAVTAYQAAQAEATAKASKEAQETDSSLAAQASSTADNNSV